MQVQASSSSNGAFSNQKSFSKKIHERVLKLIQDITDSLDKLEIKSNEDEKYFFDGVNHYYQDLVTNIFHLRKVTICIGGKNQGARDLQDVLMSLNKLAGLTQESLNLSADELKTKLKNYMVEMGTVVEELLKIIHSDDLHEYKQKVLDAQHDLVLCVERFKLHNQVRCLDIIGLEGLMHDITDKVKNNLVIIKAGHQHLEEEFSHYMRHGVQIIQDLLDHMKRTRNIENFKGNSREAFKLAENFASRSLEEMLEAVRYDNPMTKMLDVIHNVHNNVTSGTSELKILFENNSGETEMKTIKNMLPHLYINSILGFYCINLSIEDAIINLDGERS